ncbi:MAG: amidohydrolase, partial [bacterium]|nr:amidohydrolase [bacterium]
MLWTVAVGAGDEMKAPYRMAADQAVVTWLGEHLPANVKLYKQLHANPELSHQEQKTAALVAGRLKDAGYQVTTQVGGTGVVGVMANGDGPTVLIRGDMDALPIVEDTGLPYASQVRVKRDDGTSVGVMHACGHDVHVVNLTATAEVMAELRDRWRGTVVIVAQPAEELGQGAKAMMADGLFERFPRPDVCIALHVTHNLPAGQVGLAPGWAFANVDSVDVTVFGRGGHGARPHEAVDPVLAAAYLVTNLQTLVSRRLDPVDSGVVTVGSIHGGSKHNIIPDEVRLQLTVRSYGDRSRALLLDGIRQIAVDTCRTHGCPRPPEVAVRDEFTPASYNDPDLTAAATALFERMFGTDNVVQQRPEMGGEDFGSFARHLKVPGLQFRIG